MNVISKIWHDPVGSKLIATGIISIFAVVTAFIKSLFENKSFIEVLCSIPTYDIPIWFIALTVIVIIFPYAIYNKRKNKKRMEDQIIRYKNPFITFRNQGTDQRYCANCWDKDHYKIQLSEDYLGCFECSQCKTKGNFEELEKKTPPPYSPFYRS